jgi:hypothetical protein
VPQEGRSFEGRSHRQVSAVSARSSGTFPKGPGVLRKSSGVLRPAAPFPARSIRLREESRRWLTQPGILIFFGVVVLAGVGWGMLLQAAHRLPVKEATLDGLDLHLEQATWIEDQMEHGQSFQNQRP